MQTLRGLICVIIGALAMSVIGDGQTLTNKPLFEANSIRVVGNERFPEDIECEIFVGPKGSPYFHIEGERDRVKAARIEFGGSGPVVSVVQKEGAPVTYALYLFYLDTEGKVTTLFDLNMDGVWDVKRTPTRKEKNFIFLYNNWVGVERIDGLLSAKPTTDVQGVPYEFNGAWKRVK
jgi:hypothetical protein